MQEALKIIREACIAANEDILKLQFGCRIHVEGDSSEGIYVGSPTESEIMVMYGDDCIKIPIPTYMKILGRKIGLADVLLINPKEGRDYWKTVQDIVEYWNLRDDDLSHQSPETLAFIASLLT